MSLRSLCVATASEKAVDVSDSAWRSFFQSSRLLTMAWYCALNRVRRSWLVIRPFEV